MAEYRISTVTSIIIVDVFIKNKEIQKKVRMALDTGATFIMIPWEVAEILELRPEISQERIEVITASGVKRAPLITLESVKVLGKEARGVKAIVHDLPAKSYVDGLLGLSFLRNFNIHLNFKEGILEIE